MYLRWSLSIFLQLSLEKVLLMAGDFFTAELAIKYTETYFFQLTPTIYFLFT